MSEELKWGWMVVDSEEAHGEFDSKEQALRAAKDYLKDQGAEVEVEVEIGRCVYPDPTQYIDDDVGDMLERMDERAADSEFGFWDDQIFDVIDTKVAQEDLTKALHEWAKKHIQKPPCWSLEFTEKEKVGGDQK